ncbi:MAG: aminodeoxychorismate/anthranilate synthase component II, partial [Gemmatimonadales bacterium]
MILLLDARDSFVHTLAGYLRELGREVEVVRTHQVSVPDIRSMAPEHLVLSPGPCTPAEAGVFVPAVQAFHGRIPILGVCLGHQAIWAALGGGLRAARPPLHGGATPVMHGGHSLFREIPAGFIGARYHSL